MYKYILISVLILFANSSSFAQERHTKTFDFNKDRFQAGSFVVQDTKGIDDLFMMGENVHSKQDIAGSAHLAGRQVISTGDIGGDAYFAGMEISISGKITGDVTAAGYTIELGEIDGDLRASGSSITLSGPVAGYTLVSGKQVKLNSVFSGDMSMRADNVDFADNARIEGNLIIYEKETGEIVIPSQVISEDRIDRRDVSEWSDAESQSDTESVGSFLGGLFRSILFVTILVALVAAVRPAKLADLRKNILAHPFKNMLFGFLTIAVGLGAAILFLLTGIGFSLALVSLLVALLGALSGYVMGTYAIGVLAIQFTNRPVPESMSSKLIAAGLGALIISVIAKIPFLGWIVVLSVMFAGAGSIAVRMLRPKMTITTPDFR